MLDKDLAALALWLRRNPNRWTVLDEIVVDDTLTEATTSMELAAWAWDIVSGAGIWAPPLAFQAMVRAETSLVTGGRMVRMYARFIG